MTRALDPELLAEARRIQLRADRMVTDVMSGGYSSVFRGSGIEFDEVREFAEGDELRSVDWNVTARAGRPFVKKFVEERELTVMFLLDASSSMAFGTRSAAAEARAGAGASLRAGAERRTAAQTAATFVGCVAFAAARNNDKAGLVTFADEIVRYVPAKKGRNHVLRLIREACEPPENRRCTDLSAALDYVGRVQKKRAIVFVVSDFLGDDVLDCRRELRLLAKRHEVIAVRLRDPLAAGLDAASGNLQQLPNAGLLHLMDPETGERIVVDSSSRRVREQVAAQWLDQRVRMLELCRRSGVDLLDVPTEGSVAEPLVRFFRMRELRGARR